MAFHKVMDYGVCVHLTDLSASVGVRVIAGSLKKKKKKMGGQSAERQPLVMLKMGVYVCSCSCCFALLLWFLPFLCVYVIFCPFSWQLCEMS